MKFYTYAIITALTLNLISSQALAKKHHHNHHLAHQTTISEAPQVMFRGMHKINTNTDKKLIAAQSLFNIQYGLQTIDTRYQNALQTIGNSNLSQPLRQLLIKQAEQNRNFALKTFLKKIQFLTYQATERAQFKQELEKDSTCAQKVINAVNCI